MLYFWLLAGLLAAGTLAFVLRPLWQPHMVESVDRRRSNISIFRDRLVELESDRDSGVLSDERFAEAKADLERELLQDVSRDEANLNARPSKPAAIITGVVGVVLAVGLYLQIGGTEAFDAPGPDAMQGFDREAQIQFVRDNVDTLRAQVAANPDELEPTLMLARSYMVLQELDQALAVYEAAYPRFRESPQLLADYAEALAFRNGGRFDGEPGSLIQEALEVDPAHPKALWLAGVTAMQANQQERAEDYWRRLLAVLRAGSSAAMEIQQVLADMGAGGLQPAPSDDAHARMTVGVTLAPELAERVSADATVFVLARAAGEGAPRAPLAVARHAVADLPLEVVLDESMAMVPDLSLATVPEVVIEVRVSRSGQAEAAPGDLFGRSEPLVVGQDESVTVVIDEVVE